MKNLPRLPDMASPVMQARHPAGRATRGRYFRRAPRLAARGGSPARHAFAGHTPVPVRATLGVGVLTALSAADQPGSAGSTQPARKSPGAAPPAPLMLSATRAVRMCLNSPNVHGSVVA
jgi:hypothetical protein